MGLPLLIEHYVLVVSVHVMISFDQPVDFEFVNGDAPLPSLEMSIACFQYSTPSSLQADRTKNGKLNCVLTSYAIVQPQSHLVYHCSCPGQSLSGVFTPAYRYSITSWDVCLIAGSCVENALHTHRSEACHKSYVSRSRCRLF
jgi:hypothetical protein